MSVKVIVYMHITPNGMIAREDGSGFSSKAAKNGFLRMIKKVKVNVVGRKTFEVALKKGRFPFEGLNVIVTTSKIKNKWDNVIVTDKKPREILNILAKKGCKAAMVGGGILATGFIKDGLVDELYLDIEPVVFGRGVRLFSEESFYKKLRLLSAKKFSKNEIRLHYKVIN